LKHRNHNQFYGNFSVVLSTEKVMILQKIITEEKIEIPGGGALFFKESTSTTMITTHNKTAAKAMTTACVVVSPEDSL
jgi:hypothetical protein